MTCFTSGAAVVLIICTTACASTESSRDPGIAEKHAYNAPPMEPSRTISERVCRYAFNHFEGNIRCM
jgi:hypothetical protein